MSTNRSIKYSRRAFIGTSLAGLAGITLFPLKSCTKPSDTINLGFIGLGRQANYLMGSFIKIDGVRVLAGADVYAIKRDRFKIKADNFYKNAEITQEVKVYENYKELLDRKDIDAVVIAVPDHWHALIAIEACKAGKDIYLEKPLTLTIKEGIELVKAVRANNRILAVGSQQRSDAEFQHTIKVVNEKKIGQLTKVYAFNGNDPFPKPYNLPQEEVPAGLNWEKWLGPLPYYHFNKELNPPISLDPPKNEEFWGGWRWYKEFGGGLMTDWGAHMIDIAQWGMGVDKSGPVKIIPPGVDGAEFLTYIYKNGLNLTIQPFNGDKRGVKFFGTDGWVEVARGYFDASDESLKPEAKKEKDDTPYEGRPGHHGNFIDAVKNRVDPIVPVEIGHRTCTACTLGNISFDLNRALEWNPDTESFVNDNEAQAQLFREYQNGYTL